MKTAKETFDSRYEYYRNMESKPAIPLEARQLIFDVMEEYAQEHTKDCYPKEFVIYCICNVASYGDTMYSISDEKMVFTNINGLFLYWRDNIK